MTNRNNHGRRIGAPVGVWALTDLDDMLFTTTRQEPEPDAEVAAWDANGSVCGYFTGKQRLMLDLIESGCRIVPVTARSTAALERMRLPATGYSITAFGGTIHGAHGTPLKTWQRRIQKGATAASADLTSLSELMRDRARADRIDARVNVVTDYGTDLYLSVKHNHHNHDELSILAAVLRMSLPEGWTYHFNDNFLAAYPPFLGKEKAVEWFIANIVPEGAVTIGMGDSLTDIPFMSLCDYLLIPRKSQNYKQLIQALTQGR